MFYKFFELWFLYRLYLLLLLPTIKKEPIALTIVLLVWSSVMFLLSQNDLFG